MLSPLGSAFLSKAGLAGGTGFLDALVAGGAEEVVEKIGGFALFIPREVCPDVGDVAWRDSVMSATLRMKYRERAGGRKRTGGEAAHTFSGKSPALTILS
jgi:hypothetical protein